jgi:hypothetical protein
LKDTADLGRFNRGDEGFIDRDNDAYGWQPVDATTNATRPYPYPDDVLTEIEAKAIVTSIPYRAYSQGAASGGGVIVTSDDNTVFGRVEQASDSLDTATTGTDWTTRDTFDPSVDTSEIWCYFHIRAGANANRFDVRIENVATAEYYPDQNGLSEFQEADSNRTFGAIGVPGDFGGFDELDFQTKTDSAGNTFGWETNWNAWGQHQHVVDVPNHTHDPQPGLIEFGTETASNVDLIVNGTTVASDIGSGEFSTTVDIGGELTQGSNTIEVSSDSLGLVNLLVQTQLFRRGRVV